VKKQWCIPEVSAEFVWRMEDVLELYEEPYDPKRPTVCFDEMPYQMVAEKRVPIPAKPEGCATSSCSSSRRLLGATSISGSGARHATSLNR
jgi:hypothetical protein